MSGERGNSSAAGSVAGTGRLPTSPHFRFRKRSGTRSGGSARELQATLIDRGERAAASSAEYKKDEDKKDNKKRGMAYGYGKD